MFRTQQYLKLFLIPKFINSDSISGNFVLKYCDLCSTFRKVVRLGKVILGLNSIRLKIRDSKEFSFAVLFDCLSILSENLYCLVDHIILINKIGAYKFSKETMLIIDYWENLLWVYETLFAILADIFNFKNIKSELDSLHTRVKSNNSDSDIEQNSDYLIEKKELLKVRLLKLVTNEVRLWSDVIVLLYFYKYSVSPWVAGVFGVLGSLAGCYQTLGG